MHPQQQGNVPELPPLLQVRREDLRTREPKNAYMMRVNHKNAKMERSMLNFLRRSERLRDNRLRVIRARTHSSFPSSAFRRPTSTPSLRHRARTNLGVSGPSRGTQVYHMPAPPDTSSLAQSQKRTLGRMHRTRTLRESALRQTHRRRNFDSFTRNFTSLTGMISRQHRTAVRREKHLADISDSQLRVSRLRQVRDERKQAIGAARTDEMDRIREANCRAKRVRRQCAGVVKKRDAERRRRLRDFIYEFWDGRVRRMERTMGGGGEGGGEGGGGDGGTGGPMDGPLLVMEEGAESGGRGGTKGRKNFRRRRRRGRRRR